MFHTVPVKGTEAPDTQARNLTPLTSSHSLALIGHKAYQFYHFNICTFLHVCHYYLILRMAFSLSTANWHLPSTSTRIKSCAAAATDLQYPWKEFRVDSRNEVLCAWEKIGRTGLQIHIFRRSWFWVQFLYLLISRKTLKLCMVMTVFQG